MHPLDGIDAKLARAKEHLDTLNREFDEYMELDAETPRPIALDLNHEEGIGVIRWLEAASPPLRWSVVLGEFFYCLRSALDHLAWQLVLTSGGTPTNRTEFPVFKDEEEFKRRAPAKMAGMSRPIRALIRDLQPWREWPEHPTQTTLWRVHELNIVDKHRLLHLTDLWMYTLQIRFLFPGPPGHFPKVASGPKVDMPVRLQPEAVLANIAWDVEEMRAFSAKYGEEQMKVQIGGSVDVAMAEGDWIFDSGEPGAMQLRHLMHTSLDYMNATLLPKFASYFPPRDHG